MPTGCAVSASLSKRFEAARYRHSKQNYHTQNSNSILPSGKIESHYDGVSMKAVLLNMDSSLNRSALFSICPHGPVAFAGASINTGSWKLIRRFAIPVNRSSPYELYNLDIDLGESNNMEHRFPHLVMSLSRQLDQFVTETNSLIPIPNPRYNHSEAVSLGLA